MRRKPILIPWLPLTGAALLALAALADGPADNIATQVRPVPPAGIAVPDADRRALDQSMRDLGAAIERLRQDAKAVPFLPDVIIFHTALRYALTYNEFFAPADIQRARMLATVGMERAQHLEKGETPWLTTPGPTALGYVSNVDGSVQPYGLYIPSSYTPNSPHRWRLDTWFHGRGETLSEVNFLGGALRGGGPFVRPDTFTVQPYGRYCCGNKLVGEVDLFEALADIQRRYKIDEDRIVIRGFSMGGAACWVFAAHYAWRWAAAAPGAGFSETPEFLKVFQKESLKPTWWEQKLWRMYDCPYYAPNFQNLPLVAYSGENDSQKQAADVMEKALAQDGIRMVHIIGPKTGHSYHPDAVRAINDRVDRIAAVGRNPYPRRVRFATPTLKYNRQSWVRVDGLEKHWEVAQVDAEVVDDHTIRAKTENVTAISFTFPSGHAPLDVSMQPTVSLDGQKVKAERPWSDRSWTASFHRDGDRWMLGALAESQGMNDLRKRHNLQGPIDDAFMGSFLIVRPTGKPQNPGVSAWVDAEMKHAVGEWRRQFRGDPRVKDDSQVGAEDIASHHLALWGDPGSNRVLARIAAQGPIQWTADAVVVGGKSYPAGAHAPILVFPNPLNPRKYVVLNSGFTYREYDYLNNARQVPKLPDWAIVDITTPPNSRYPGKIVNANFFGERWELIEQAPK